ncbi:ABC transporter substrate-binding protein [Sulfurirhabdus autotrophica]|uniref:Amino acid/amide ABC transporter substrate-binding protein (HAAT family) n=1 Tax=Sulfurirhabdus autotrophica TaxID=1706046 RepID=A0A4R3Y7U8_9PROT|nr:ABC transporter substrate-binding protein [Sulfurirhabdus autotrophica]TCV86353.1 amino acid/amide ABC transporter substrate-binding protein (HAAT family) [Sulfurirhabdus autotrophica]
MNYLNMLSRIGIASLALALSVTAKAETGVTDHSIVLGQSVVLSGPSAELGQEMRDGAKAYFDYVNSQGGVNGRKIELKTLDDGYEPARAVENTKKLIAEENVFALFGYVGTPTSKAALPVFTEGKVPFFGAFTGAELLRDPVNRYVFNVRASYYDETEKIVNHLTKLGLTKIAIFYQNDAYGQAGLAGVERALKKRNMSLAGSGTVERNSVNVTAAVKSISAAKPQAIIMISVYKSETEFVKQMKAAIGYTQYYTISFVGSRSLARELGPDAAGVSISQVVPMPFDEKVLVVKEYHKIMKKFAPQSPIGFTSLEGFIAANAFVEGLKRAGSNLTRERLVEALEKMDTDIGGFRVRFSPTSHSGSKFTDLTVITKEGTFRN